MFCVATLTQYWVAGVFFGSAAMAREAEKRISTVTVVNDLVFIGLMAISPPSCVSNKMRDVFGLFLKPAA
jgi:hypothetical protein